MWVRNWCISLWNHSILKDWGCGQLGRHRYAGVRMMPLFKACMDTTHAHPSSNPRHSWALPTSGGRCSWDQTKSYPKGDYGIPRLESNSPEVWKDENTVCISHTFQLWQTYLQSVSDQPILKYFSGTWDCLFSFLQRSKTPQNIKNNFPLSSPVLLFSKYLLSSSYLSSHGGKWIPLPSKPLLLNVSMPA